MPERFSEKWPGRHHAASVIIIVSRTLTYDVLAHGRLSSSSQKFESGFAKACTAIAEVTVVNVHSTYVGSSDEKLIGPTRFRVVGYRDLLSTLRKIAQKRDAVVITTGYDPVLMSVLVLCRLFRLRTFTFIYDTHRLAMQNQTILRKMAIGIYYDIGFFIARFADGWLVLNDRFVLGSRLPTPRYLKTRVGVDTASLAVLPRAETVPMLSGNKPVFLFSGTLNSDNGTEILLQAMEQVGDQDFELHIYGYGPLEHLVEAAAKRDPRIVFFGRTENAEVTLKQRSADVLIHLRDPFSVASDYSYPSKLIEYLCSDRPVVSNTFPGIDDVASCLIEIEDFSSLAVARTLSRLLDGSEPIVDRTGTSQMLAARQGWDKVATEVLEFVADKPHSFWHKPTPD